VLSVKVPDPKFSSQTKDKLVSSEVRPAVEGLVGEKLAEWFEEKPQHARVIVRQDHRGRARARGRAQGARAHPRKTAMDVNFLAGKLKDCSEKDPAKTEVFLVEGDTAGARPRRAATAAPRPCCRCAARSQRGARALRPDAGLPGDRQPRHGAGHRIGRDEFNLSKLRYHKIVIMTDADVDGAHIRTLLLTFFFRQMPQLIEGGFLYIAQPPLYKVSRGRSEVYLKDQAALEAYLIEQGVEGAGLRLGDGTVIAGPDLARVVEEARVARATLNAFPTHYPRHVLEQATIAGALAPGALDADPQGIADRVAARLDLIAAEYERGWRGLPTQDRGLRVWRVLRGVEEAREIDGFAMRSAEARRLAGLTGSLREVYGEVATLVRKDRDQAIYGPTDLLEAVMREGEKGLSLQRYKGLGEMNPEQLWETTLDPEARTLLQVRVEHADEADEVFTKLMGDEVEPRREFIQTNALSVANLDF
jgi:DNA gyrase subunit B